MIGGIPAKARRPDGALRHVSRQRAVRTARCLETYIEPESAPSRTAHWCLQRYYRGLWKVYRGSIKVYRGFIEGL